MSNLNDSYQSFLEETGKQSLNLTCMEERGPEFQTLLMDVLSYFESLSSYSNLQESERDDVCQMALIKVWRNVHRYDPTKSKFSTWCSVIFERVRIDFFRKSSVLPMESLEIRS